MAGEAHAHPGHQREAIARPPFTVAVWGDDFEQADQTIPFELVDALRYQ
jgi:hypothetical protein